MKRHKVEQIHRAINYGDGAKLNWRKSTIRKMRKYRYRNNRLTSRFDDEDLSNR